MRVIVVMTRKDISSDFRESDAAACQRGVIRSFPNKAFKTDNLPRRATPKSDRAPLEILKFTTV